MINSDALTRIAPNGKIKPGDIFAVWEIDTVSPEPDSVLRVFMAWQGLEAAVDIQPQELPTFQRSGFTVVEWGGAEIE